MLDYAHRDDRATGEPKVRRRTLTEHYDVVLLHRDEAMRQGLQTMLAALQEIRTVTSVDEADDFVDLVTEHRPEVAIIASSVEPSTGQILLEAASRQGTKVLLLLHSLDRRCVVRASRLTVDGFLVEHGLTTESLRDSLRALRAGGLPVPPSLVRELLSEMNGDGQRDRPRHLTPREHATLELIVEGLSNKQVARRLEISEHGAKRHVANVLAKLNCPNRTMAAAVAVRDGLVEA